MNQNNNYKFSRKERELFGSIANHIYANPEDYREAGKWLDEYCSESAYWTRKKEELKKLKEQHRILPVLTYQREVDHLENEIKEKRTPASIIRFQEAQHYLLDNYRDQEFLSKEVATKIIIITWLLTDPDAEKANLHITEFEKWKWEPLDDVFKGNRDFKGFLFAQNKGPWMRLVNIAWDKVSGDVHTGGITKWLKKNYKWLVPTVAAVVIAVCTVLELTCRTKTPITEQNSVGNLTGPNSVSQIIDVEGDYVGRDKINASGDYVAGDKIVKQELLDTNELSKFGDSQKALGKMESELEKKTRENRELQSIIDAYKRDDKEFRSALKLAENTEKTRVIAKILQEHDKGNITKEEALKLSDMVNKTLWEDLKSFLENKNVQVDEHNQSLVVSGIFMAKARNHGLRARYNPAEIYYVLTSEGNKLYEIAKNR